jgi:peptide/nickel transport system substrate-binding protein
MSELCPRWYRCLAIVTIVVLTLIPTGVTGPAAAAPPSGQLAYAVHMSLAPTWFDPAETPSLITPFMVLHAVHDALVKFMPGAAQGKSLAEAWSVSKDGLVYEFVLRKGVKFHNGDVMTIDDIKSSFERYRAAAAKLLKDRMAAVEVVSPLKVRFRLKKPWIDFMTFFVTPATGAAWIVPKKYVEKVDDDGFKKAPIGAGPYKFVSFKPGVELVLEAHEDYWRKPPAIKTPILRVIPDESTPRPVIQQL